MGFSHMKVRADMLTSGMGGAQAAVAAEDLKKLLSRHGLNLIAERVEDEKTVVQLLDYAVDLPRAICSASRARCARKPSGRRKRPGHRGPVLPLRKAVIGPC